MKPERRTLLQRVMPLLCISAGLAGLSLPSRAQPPEGKGQGKGNKHGKGEAQGDGGGVQVSIGISVEQARSYAVQGGFTGYKPLPPGIRKNLARGKPLPPGIAKKAAPAALLRQLPQRPGYEWQVCGTDLVLVAVGTLIVAEVLKSVFD
jgi:hypothetical protein